jgi:DNA-3-methyladenine glycosylase
VDAMLKRTGKPKADHTLTKGPGNMSKAMGILVKHNALGLQTDELCIVDDGCSVKSSHIIATPRIGVAYAAEDAMLPYRFILKDSLYVSGKKNKR